MIRHLKSFVFVAGTLIAAPAFAGELLVDAAPPAGNAASRGYATVFGGVSLPSARVSINPTALPYNIGFDLDFDAGYIVGGAIGTTLLPHLRGEVEFSVVKSTLSEFYNIPVDVGLESTGYNVLGNLWYDVDTNSAFMPYVGGGLGWGYDVLTSDGEDIGINTSGFLYQLGVGVRFAATENIGFDLGYRYRVQPDAIVSGDGDDSDEVTVKSSATNHIVQAGVTVGF